MRKRICGDPRRDYAAEWSAFREARGWPISWMANALGIHPVTVRSVEKGLTRPSIRTREKMKQLQERYKENKAWVPQPRLSRNL